MFSTTKNTKLFYYYVQFREILNDLNGIIAIQFDFLQIHFFIVHFNSADGKWQSVEGQFKFLVRGDVISILELLDDQLVVIISILLVLIYL